MIGDAEAALDAQFRRRFEKTVATGPNYCTSHPKGFAYLKNGAAQLLGKIAAVWRDHTGNAKGTHLRDGPISPLTNLA
jgi:hypothetical protein